MRLRLETVAVEAALQVGRVNPLAQLRLHVAGEALLDPEHLTEAGG